VKKRQIKSVKLRPLLLILFLEAVLFLCLLRSYSRPTALKTSAPTPPTSAIQQAPNYQVIARYQFQNQASLKAWEEKIFKGVTQYQVLSETGRHFLKSKTKDACSGLYVKVDAQAAKNLYLSWRWRALLFPKKKEPEKISNKTEDDFAARIYVIFPGSNFFKSDVIEYLWDKTNPAGTVASSPFSDRIKLFVLRSGPAPAAEGGWFAEERNVFQDYEKLYGRPPTKPVGAIALMSDSDTTGTSSEADFAEITLKTKAS